MYFLCCMIFVLGELIAPLIAFIGYVVSLDPHSAAYGPGYLCESLRKCFIILGSKIVKTVIVIALAES